MANWSDPDDGIRTRHACWAMPGAVMLIVLMILVFAAPFTIEEKGGGDAPLGPPTVSSDPGVTVLAAAHD